MNASPLALAAAGFGIAGMTLCLGGILAIQVGLASAMGGFYAYGLGSLVGLLGLLTGLIGLWWTRPATGRGGRRQAMIGAGLGGVLVLALLGAAAPSGDLPPINDITTDITDPPRFVAALTLDANEERDMTYLADDFAAPTREAYADLQTVIFDEPPVAVHAAALEAIEVLGWELTDDAPSAGRIEARESTAIFRFVDDVVIRIRPHRRGAELDVRSKSRDGRGDLGANAARIRAFQDQLEIAL